jgi:fumarate reductase flavoprotein subunit
MERDYDIAIIGSGGAGLAAAITAREAGASVIVLEADDRVGGSTSLSGGVFYAAGTSVQRAREIEDTADAMYEYYLTLNQWRVEPAIVRRLCDGAAPALEWLIELGVEFPPEALYASGVESVPRGHMASGAGAAIASALHQAAGARGVEIVLRTRADRLRTEEGRVTGVRAEGVELRTAAVVVASGGFGHNPRLLHRHYPEAARHGDWTWSISAPCCKGDGLALGEQVGAAIAGNNQGLLLITPGFDKHLEVYSPGWLLFVNREGRRFVDETAPYAVMSGVVGSQTGGSCFAVFDEATRARAEPDPVFADAFAAGVLPLSWVNSVIDQEVERGKVLRADSLAELAERAGIHAGALQATAERYSADCRRGEDPAFFKASEALRPVATAPFFAAEIRPAIVCFTATGLRIDEETRVLDGSERPIPGLFAAGETTGGVMGERYVGGGASIANAVVFGRIAGGNAAAHAALGEVPLRPPLAGIRPKSK